MLQYKLGMNNLSLLSHCCSSSSNTYKLKGFIWPFNKKDSFTISGREINWGSQLLSSFPVFVAGPCCTILIPTANHSPSLPTANENPAPAPMASLCRVVIGGGGTQAFPPRVLTGWGGSLACTQPCYQRAHFLSLLFSTSIQYFPVKISTLKKTCNKEFMC